jgi:hypothetical protein
MSFHIFTIFIELFQKNVVNRFSKLNSSYTFYLLSVCIPINYYLKY